MTTDHSHVDNVGLLASQACGSERELVKPVSSQKVLARDLVPLPHSSRRAVSLHNEQRSNDSVSLVLTSSPFMENLEAKN